MSASTHAEPKARRVVPHASTSTQKGPETPVRHDWVAIIGRVASILSVLMYVSYIAQIGNNLSGHPGTPWQPLCAFFNCVMWSLYGFLKPKKDYPIIVANVPGIFLALVTVMTTFIH